MALRSVQFLSIVLTALALAPAAAHLFALVNKIGLPQERYFAVQAIYRGWALLGAVDVAALACTLALAALSRPHRLPLALAIAAAVTLALNLAGFFVWTYPANRATHDWTVAPADWTTLRAQWEYAHAAGAALVFAALCCTTLSVLTRPP